MSIEKDLLSPIPESSDGNQITSRLQKKVVYTNREVDPSSESTSGEGLLSESANDLRNALPAGTDIEDIISRQRKVREISSLCDKLDKEIDSILATISSQIKDYDVQVDISKKPLLKKAVRKIFKKPYNYINKEMYLDAVKRMRELQDKLVEEAVEDV